MQSTQLLTLLKSSYFISDRRRLGMKELSSSVFILIMTATSSFAWGEGGCASKNTADLQAMSCAAGYSWSEEAGECVQDVSA